MSPVHAARDRLRAALRGGTPLVGTFVKLAGAEPIELVAAAGYDFAVVDLEHSSLSESDAMSAVRLAGALGLAALVRVPQVDRGAINRLLEAGAAGIQLSMLASAAQRDALLDAVSYAPSGTRSISLGHRGGGYGAEPLGAYLAAERASAPLVVGQIESAVQEPLPDVVRGLDVAFVGTTDLAVSLGIQGDDAAVTTAVETVAAAARDAQVAFGGWAPRPDAAAGLGLSTAAFLVVGSDVQFLGAALRAARPSREDS